MRNLRTATAFLGAALLVVPSLAAVKALTLAELMTVNTEAARVRILGKSSFASDYPLAGVVWTRLVVEGVSLRTGEPVATEVVFLGSHDPRDGYGTSEMPALQDTRVGGEAVMFWFRDEAMPARLNVVSDHTAVYRVERGFGEPVLVGKGEGLAFPENVKLAEAAARVGATHVELALRAGQGK
jgi:hypothetical protein